MEGLNKSNSSLCNGLRGYNLCEIMKKNLVRVMLLWLRDIECDDLLEKKSKFCPWCI